MDKGPEQHHRLRQTRTPSVRLDLLATYISRQCVYRGALSKNCFWFWPFPIAVDHAAQEGRSVHCAGIVAELDIGEFGHAVDGREHVIDPASDANLTFDAPCGRRR